MLERDKLIPVSLRNVMINISRVHVGLFQRYS